MPGRAAQGPGVYVIVKKHKGREIPVYVGRADDSVISGVAGHHAEPGRIGNPRLYGLIHDQGHVRYVHTPLPDAVNRRRIRRAPYVLYLERYELLNTGVPEGGRDCEGCRVQPPH